MRNLILRLIVGMIIILNIANCHKNEDDNNSVEALIKLLDIVSTNQYYETDSLDILYHGINGVWKAIISEDGLGIEYTPKFDYLLIKPNSIFGIVRNDTLLTYGKIRIDGQFNNFVSFEEINPINESLSHFINSSFVECISIDDKLMEISTCGARSGHKTKFELNE
jgi:hypothetical protein